ncbi:hypothetical protein [Halorussus halobius]|uniref:hypothetical protein n=1 Tax=Halorussus halobius TaxID=1710537 RepID=UPI001091D269|nr:hypothetical protein [Halorussus halobius]
MASDSASSDPPAQKATDEEVLAAVERVSRGLDAPAVPTSQVAAELPIARQTVKRRLDDLADEGRIASLATGQGRIWWLPDGEGGHVDPAALDRPFDVGEVDPHDVPPELAREIATERLPEFGPPETFWERLYDWSDGRADDVVTLVAVALVVLAAPTPGLFEDRLLSLGVGVGLVDLLGLLALAGGALVGVATGLARIAGGLGRRAADRGYVPDDPFAGASPVGPAGGSATASDDEESG